MLLFLCDFFCSTWRELTIVCIDVGEYTLAHRSALNLIGAVDQLKDIILHYERHGLFDEVISLLEAGIADDRAQVSLFTEVSDYLWLSLSCFIPSLND